MKTSSCVSGIVSGILIIGITAVPVCAEERSGPIASSAAKAAAAAAVEAQSGHHARGSLFWPGVALGVTGATMGVLAVTTARVENSNSGNAPPGAYNACVALKNSDPVYAANN